MAELARVALTAHKTPVSRIVAIAVKLLRRQSIGLRLVVSYADPREGHHGGIYQAGNWVYVGDTPPDVRYVDRSGTEHHPRMACSTGVKISFGVRKRVVKTQDCTKVQVPGKHKYLMPLDPEMRAKILPLAKPYPKRVASDTGDTPSVQEGKGGSTPTATLQIDPPPDAHTPCRTGTGQEGEAGIPAYRGRRRTLADRPQNPPPLTGVIG